MRGTLLVLLLAPLVVRGDEVAEPAGYWSGPINSAVPATISGGRIIQANELAELLKHSAPVVIDVSSAPKKPEGISADTAWLPLPHEAIPGSAWIPGAGLGEIPADIDDYFREYLSRQTDDTPDHPVVIYCHEHCWLSWNAAKRAISYGYRHVYWFPEGIEGWRAAGFTTEVVRENTIGR